jgi:hypothetical protein
MKQLLSAALFLAGSALLVSCGGGGGSGDSTAATSVAPATVGVVITDASSDDWDKALATITSVTLISDDDGHEEIFSGVKVVDLLALREHVKLLVVKQEVKPGYYSKIRLHISRLVLVKENVSGPPITQEVKIPSGKVDLNPKGTFYIAPGSVAFASFDWDMEKSLKLIETGSGKWIMRPVIFVHIGTKPVFKQGLVRLFGTVESVGDLGFRLCSTSAATPVETGSDDFCVNVLVKGNTGIFDSGGAPRLDEKKVMKGEELTVVGLLRRTDYDDDDNDIEHHGYPDAFSKGGVDSGDDKHPKFLVSAIVVEVGPAGTWERVRGVLTKTVDGGTNQIEFDPDVGQGYDDVTLLTAQLFAQSRVFRLKDDGTIEEIAPSDLLLLDRAAVDAVKLVSTGTGPDLNVAVMLVRPAPVTATLTGTIMSVSPLGGWVIIDDGDPCVTTNNLTTRAYILSDSGVKEVSVTDLEVHSSAVVTSTTTTAGCLNADVIVASAPASP